ncbi:toll/interleukin-1 receptor domain-containing protein [Rhodococcus pyridinivorans]|uniref:toll/interleukin-1 receptor domain-containing protein n=1 Tax=Rhodococcus pyridinivorans TaxID=103816 RepID=UPI001908396F|nr:toll/interleukin-1 receptor domain-containing protein [Rhodococcus pyridinivorans]QQM51883.1 toll/interleukin-1 receptor domain-containing protein [Rhodococcus pyridinivorans]
MMDSKKDYFISYNKADKQWAEWIAWTLEQEGFAVVIEEWDFKAGGNFAVEMDLAMKECVRTIPVLSPDYLAANYTVTEWTDKFADDPQGFKRLLVPVRVRPCNPQGILKQVIYIDLVGLSDEEARKKLLSQLNPGRTKPATAPAFPGSASSSDQNAVQVVSVVDGGALWQPLNSPIGVQWGTSSQSRYSRATLEVHSISVGGGNLGARELRELPERLTVLGRQSGLFEQAEGADSTVQEGFAETRVAGRFDAAGDRGLRVYKNREIVSWLPLPHDNLGSVFDEKDIRNRLVAILGAHATSGLLTGAEVSFAVSVGPVMLMTIGSADIVDNRSSASLMMSSASNDSVRIEPSESVERTALRSSLNEIADELTSQLVLKLTPRR